MDTAALSAALTAALDARAAPLRCPVRGHARADAWRRQHGVRRRGRRSRHRRRRWRAWAFPTRRRSSPACVAGITAAIRAVRSPRGARAADRGAAAADRGAGQDRRPGPRLHQLRPLPVRVAVRRAALLAAAGQPEPAAASSPTSWAPRRAWRASWSPPAACSMPCSIRASSAACPRPNVLARS